MNSISPPHETNFTLVSKLTSYLRQKGIKKMEQTNYNRLLINEPPLQVLPSLAVALKSVDKAIIVQQIHYWLNTSNHFKDGRKWVYNTMDEWQKQFPWIANSTLRRHFKQLEQENVLLTANYNKAKFDRTKWYSLNYKKISILERSTKCSILANGTANIERTYTIDYTETNINNHFSKMIANALLNKLNLLSYKDDKQILDTANVVIKFKDQLRDELLVYGIERVRQNQVHNSNIKNNAAGYLTSVYKHWLDSDITTLEEAKRETKDRYTDDLDNNLYSEAHIEGYDSLAEYKEHHREELGL